MKFRLVLFTLLPCFLLACQDSEPLAPEPEPAEASPSISRDTVLAQSTIKTWTVEELDLLLRKERAEKPNIDFSRETYERVLRKYAFQAFSLHELEERTASQEENTEFLSFRRKRKAESDLCSERYLTQLAQGLKKADLEEYFETHQEQFSLPSKRLVFHIFLNRFSEDSQEALMERAEDLRARVHDLKTFKELAVQVSDSETKVKEGLLGWVKPGVLAPALEEILFSLEPRVVSSPVSTKTGVHLFWVDEAYEGAEHELPEILRKVAEAYALEVSGENFEEFLASSPLEETFSQANASEILEALEGKNPELLVVKGEGFEFHLGQIVAVQQLPESVNLEALAGQIHQGSLNFLMQEQFIRFCREQEKNPKSFEKALEKKVLEERQALAVQVLLREKLDKETERLKEFFSNNRKRFVPPQRWTAVRVSLQAGDADLLKTQGLLMELRQKILQGEQELEEGAKALGAKVEKVEGKPLQHFQALSVKVAEAMSVLSPGEITLPIRLGDTLEMIQVLDKESPAPLDFEKARERVLNEYLAAYEEQLNEELRQDLLEKYDFQVDSDSLEEITSFTLAGMPDTGASSARASESGQEEKSSK